MSLAGRSRRRGALGAGGEREAECPGRPAVRLIPARLTPWAGEAIPEQPGTPVVRKPGRLPSAPTAPPWLAEVVRPAPAPVPWPAVIRAALAVCGPLALGLALGDQLGGLLGAMGGLLGTVVDRGGTYPGRIRRIVIAGIFGGAAGLLLGVLVHGRGWIAVVVLVLVAGLSALLSAAGATAAITGLQLLVYSILGTGPLGMARPWWLAAAAAAGWRGLGDPAAGTRVASRAPGPGAAQHRRRLPRPGQDAARGRHAGVPRGPSGRRRRAEHRPGTTSPPAGPGPAAGIRS